MSDLTAVHIDRDGTIRVDGEAVGVVFKLLDGIGGRNWRAEVGTPAEPAKWRVSYASTRKGAVADVLAGWTP